MCGSEAMSYSETWESLPFSKTQQLKKNRKPNPKKLDPLEKEAFESFIFKKARGKCQCGCGRAITEYHHAKFGRDKDDRTLVGIAQHPCHYNIHHGKDADEKHRLILLTEHKGDENWRDFSEQ